MLCNQEGYLADMLTALIDPQVFRVGGRVELGFPQSPIDTVVQHSADLCSSRVLEARVQVCRNLR